MLDSETAKELIKPHMVVVSAYDDEVATVDHVEGLNSIKLTKDERGEHHYIPLSWVTSVDDKVHIDRDSSQLEREWSTRPVTDPS